MSHQLSRDVPLSLEGNFLVKPAFLQIIRKVNGVDPKKVIFTYKEVSFILFFSSFVSRYTLILIHDYLLENPTKYNI